MSFWKVNYQEKYSGACRRTQPTLHVKLRKGVEAAGGRIIENDRYLSEIILKKVNMMIKEIYCDKRRAN